MKTIGKITRLPAEIREQFHERMQDGEKPTSLLKWLNGLPEVQTLVAEKFGGRPLTRHEAIWYTLNEPSSR